MLIDLQQEHFTSNDKWMEIKGRSLFTEELMLAPNEGKAKERTLQRRMPCSVHSFLPWKKCASIAFNCNLWYDLGPLLAFLLRPHAVNKHITPVSGPQPLVWEVAYWHWNIIPPSPSPGVTPVYTMAYRKSRLVNCLADCNNVPPFFLIVKLYFIFFIHSSIINIMV